MNPESDLAVFLQLVFGIWAIFFFFAVPIYFSQIAKNTKRIAEMMRDRER